MQEEYTLIEIQPEKISLEDELRLVLPPFFQAVGNLTRQMQRLETRLKNFESQQRKKVKPQTTF